MKNILITIPNQHWIHKSVAHCLLKLLQDKRYRINIRMPSHKPYVNNLHHIVNDFCNNDYDFWLNIDSDNPPMNNPLDLVTLNKDIIGLPTPIWHYTREPKERPIYWNAYDYVPKKSAYKEHLPRKGLQSVDAVGTGCLLISRRVFDDTVMRKAPFARTWNEDGTVDKGNDLAFCQRAKSRGFEIYCHYDYPCRHFSELELMETVEAMKNLYEVEK